MRNASYLSTRATIVAVAIASVFLALAPARPATAAPPDFSGGLGAPTIGKFNPVTLNGTQQLTSTSIAPFVIVDDSGALAGWHVTLVVPSFLNGTGADCSIGATSSIAGSNLSMDAPVVTAADAQTDMTGVTSAGFSDFTIPRTIISAAAREGAGTYDVAPQILKLVVPANVLVGDYCTQATIAITSGP
jgi:hypothetical protein